MIKVAFFRFNPVEENTYVLSNENNEAIIIDPGCYFTEEERTLHNYIIDNKLTVIKLLNTHCHLDHVFGNNWVRKTYNLELYLHKDEEKMLQLAPASGLMYGLTFTNYTGKLNFFEDGDIIKLGTDELEVILVPGHSPGSVCFYCAKQDFLIGGDVLFDGSIGRTDLPGGNHNQLIQGIKKRLFTLHDETIVYPGHGNKTTIKHEKVNNPFLK